MDTMNQGAPMGQAPMGTPMGAPMQPTKKKSSMGIVIVLIVIALIIALLVVSQNKDTDMMTGEEASLDGTTATVDNSSDELGDIEADINSLDFADIDAGLQ